jgi:putative hydrolase of the HAD superfamily
MNDGMRKPCMVFDLDDTLFLERDYVRSGFAAVGQWVRENFGVGNFANVAWNLFEKGQRGNILDISAKAVDLPQTPDLIQAMVTVYRSHLPQISLLPDAVTCLARFRDIALLALVTDGPLDSQRQKVTVLQLEPMFELIVFTGAWGKGFAKPHPRAFELVQSQLRPADGRYIYVADNPSKDFIAPIALGWNTVRVRRPQGLHATREAQRHEAATLEMPDLQRLYDVVNSGISRH